MIERNALRGEKMRIEAPFYFGQEVWVVYKNKIMKAITYAIAGYLDIHNTPKNRLEIEVRIQKENDPWGIFNWFEGKKYDELYLEVGDIFTSKEDLIKSMQ